MSVFLRFHGIACLSFVVNGESKAVAGGGGGEEGKKGTRDPLQIAKLRESWLVFCIG